MYLTDKRFKEHLRNAHNAPVILPQLRSYPVRRADYTAAIGCGANIMTIRETPIYSWEINVDITFEI